MGTLLDCLPTGLEGATAAAPAALAQQEADEDLVNEEEVPWQVGNRPVPILPPPPWAPGLHGGILVAKRPPPALPVGLRWKAPPPWPDEEWDLPFKAPPYKAPPKLKAPPPCKKPPPLAPRLRVQAARGI